MSQSQAPPTSFGGLSGGASSFTPRASKAIKISRPDGTPVDFKKEAAAVVSTKPASSAPSNGFAVLETPVDGQAEAPKKKTPALPIFVRLESEDQKKARLEEEARKERIRKEEEREEIERRERRERLARDEEERKAKEKEAADLVRLELEEQKARMEETVRQERIQKEEEDEREEMERIERRELLAREEEERKVKEEEAAENVS